MTNPDKPPVNGTASADDTALGRQSVDAGSPPPSASPSVAAQAVSSTKVGATTGGQVKTDVYNRKYRLPGLKMEAEKWVVQSAVERFPPLPAAQGAPTVDNTAITRWLADIAREFTGDTRHFRHNAVVDWVLDHNARLDLGLRVPMKSVRVPLPRPAITGANFPDISRARRIRTAFAQYLETNGDVGPRQSFARLADEKIRRRVAGLILLSAVVHGGVLCKDDLHALARGNVGGAWRRRTEFLTWIEWKSREVGGWRRWLADPVSALMLLRWQQILNCPLVSPEVPEKSLHIVVQSNLRKAYAVLGLTPAERPRSLAQLIRWAQCWFHVEIPPFLVSFASGKLPSASLPPTAWMRLLTGERVRVKSAVPADDADDESPVPTPGRRDPKQAELRRILLGPGAEQPGFRSALANLERFARRPDVTTLQKRLAGWCMALLGATSAEPADRRANTVRVYLETVDARLSRYFGSDDPADSLVAQRAAAYEAILEEASTELTRARVARVLGLFERFLDPQSRLADELATVVSETRQSANVDANFFATPLLESTRAAVSPAQNTHDALDAGLREVALVLGHRAKLRRIEAWRLRLGDFSGRVRPELLIRPHEGEILKSTSATRRALLHATCTPDELRLLQDHSKAQIQTARDALAAEADDDAVPDSFGLVADGPLLGRFQTGTKPIPEATLFDPITYALQVVTGDETARYHHLRHSGLNRDLILLMAPVLPNCERLLGEEATSCSVAAATLQRALVGMNFPTKTALWAVAVEAGHASPATTCGSYLHFLDWLLYCAVESSAPALTAAATAALCGTSAAAMLQRKARYPASGEHRWPNIVAHYERKLVESIQPQITSATAQPRETRSTKAATVVSASRLIDVLVAASQPPLSLVTTLRASGAAGTAYLADIRQYPPSSVEIAEAMASRLHGFTKETRKQVAEATCRPSRWLDAARSVRLDLSPQVLERVRENALSLNRIRSTSTNSKWRKTLESKGFPLLAGARTGGLHLARPLRYPVTRIGHAAEREGVDYLFRAIQTLADVDRNAVEEAITPFLAHYNPEDHHLSFAEPDESGKVAAFLRSVFASAATDGWRPASALTYEHIPHVPRFPMGTKSAKQSLPPDSQLAAWATALEIDSASVSQTGARPLDRRGKNWGLLRATLPFCKGGFAPATRPKRNSGALYHAIYVYCLHQDWAFA